MSEYIITSDVDDSLPNIRKSVIVIDSKVLGFSGALNSLIQAWSAQNLKQAASILRAVIDGNLQSPEATKDDQTKKAFLVLIKLYLLTLDLLKGDSADNQILEKIVKHRLQEPDVVYLVRALQYKYKLNRPVRVQEQIELFFSNFTEYEGSDYQKLYADKLMELYGGYLAREADGRDVNKFLGANWYCKNDVKRWQRRFKEIGNEGAKVQKEKELPVKPAPVASPVDNADLVAERKQAIFKKFARKHPHINMNHKIELDSDRRDVELSQNKSLLSNLITLIQYKIIDITQLKYLVLAAVVLGALAFRRKIWGVLRRFR